MLKMFKPKPIFPDKFSAAFKKLRSPGLEKMIQPTPCPWGYWLSLLSTGPAEVPEGQMAAAMETAQQFLIDAGLLRGCI